MAGRADTVEEVQAAKAALRADARARLGVTGVRETAAPFFPTLRAHRATVYPLVALGVLSIVDTFSGYAFSVLTPEIATALGVGKGAIAGVIALKTLAASVAPRPIAVASERRARRVLIAVVVGVLWSFAAIATGFVTAVWGLAMVLVLDGLTTGGVGAVHPPLLMDSYPPEARVRALSYYQAFNAFGNVLAPLLVAGLVTYAHVTWRGVFVVLGSLSLMAMLVTVRLRDPGFGGFDTERIRARVHEFHGEAAGAAADNADGYELGFFEIVRRLLIIRSVRRILLACAVFGVLLIPYQTFLFFFLEERWGLGVGQRGVFFAYLAVVQMIALGLYGRRGESAFREDPARVMRLASALVAAGVIIICFAGLSPWFWPMIALFGVSSGLLATIGPSFGIAVLSIIPARMRPHASALTGIFLGGVGGLIGAVFLSSIDRRYGVAGSMVSLLVPGVVGALVMRSAARFLADDLDRMIDEVIEEEEINHIRATGGHLPMLACRGIDFSYDQLQVLFGVDFTVDDGEMVALLGVNGAGKSTLLKVVSGLGLPSRGSVRLGGADITYLVAERRVQLGVTQIPGGRAVFGSTSVADNLRAFAYTLPRSRGVDTAIDECFAAFPRLGERRNQLASTLSGGEQQMLGLSKALILKPRLLLIDELSLGLAPVIVGQLLEMVRRINAAGTAVVLVEQSVNIALNLADHAYFMEKGEVRFDGRARDLLARDDLLRAVFLEGAQARNGKHATNGKNGKHA
jgi:ABC-type branched-subunit amino acid transport system ATPase component/MFS family permease